VPFSDFSLTPATYIVLACNAKKSTIAAREIATAARLVLGGELAKHALTEGILFFLGRRRDLLILVLGDKALAKYNKAVRGEA
jgi:hypothetical protein